MHKNKYQKRRGLRPSTSAASATQQELIQGPIQQPSGSQLSNDLGRETARQLRENANPNTRFIDKPTPTTNKNLLRQAAERQQSMIRDAQQQAFSKAALSQSLRSVFTITALLSSAVLTHNVISTFFTWAAVTCLFAFIDVAIVAHSIKQNEKRGFSFKNTIFSFKAIQTSLKIYQQYWPIGISIAFGAMFVYIPNYVLENYRGTKEVGQFAAISYFLVAGGILINSFAIFYKYAAYHPSRQNLHSETAIGIFSFSSLVPFFAPVCIFYLIVYARRAFQNARHCSPDVARSYR